MLTEAQLADLYTATCNAVTAAHGQGAGDAERYLARLALLLMREVGDAGKVQQAITQAAHVSSDR